MQGFTDFVSQCDLDDDPLRLSDNIAVDKFVRTFKQRTGRRRVSGRAISCGDATRTTTLSPRLFKNQYLDVLNLVTTALFLCANPIPD